MMRNLICLTTALLLGLGFVLESRAATAEENEKPRAYAIAGNTARTLPLLLAEVIREKTSSRRSGALRDAIIALGDSVVAPVETTLRTPKLSELSAITLVQILSHFHAPTSIPLLLEAAKRSDNAAVEAVASLGGFDTKPVQTFLLKYKPQTDVLRKAHAQALGSIAGSQPLTLLFTYLRSRNVGVSIRARQALGKWFDENAKNRDQVVERLSYMGGLEDAAVTKMIARNILLLCSMVPASEGRARVFAALLSSDSAQLRHEAMRGIHKYIDVLGTRDVIEALGDAIAEEEGKTYLLPLLKTLSKAKISGTIDAVQIALNHENRQVRQAAADALQTITGKNIGRNPMDWQRWLEQKEQLISKK